VGIGLGYYYRVGGAMTVNSVDSSLAPQVVEIWYSPLAAFERTVAVPKSRHGW
jgi:hypothetical protein